MTKARVGSICSFGVAVLFAASPCLRAQNAISAHSGMVNYVEGKVLLDGQAIDPKFGQFPEVKNDQVLETEQGRAELLLTPGVFLRLAENTSFKMLSNKLSDTALDMLSGTAMVEVDELMKDNAITLRYKDSTISLAKVGLYRVDADSGRLRVYDGDADATYGIKTVHVHKGKQVELNETLLASSFETKDTDAFYRWVSRRSEYIAAANVSSAHAAGHYGLSAVTPCAGQAATTPDPSTLLVNGAAGYCSPYGDPYGYNSLYGLTYGFSPYGSWIFNPYYGMFTYLPGFGYGYNPFGWVVYSPVTVGALYTPSFYQGSRLNPGGAVARRTGPTTLPGARMSSGGPMLGGAAIRANSAGAVGGPVSPGRAMGPMGPSGAVGGSSGSAGASAGGARSAAGGGAAMSGGGGRSSGGGGGGGRR